MRRVLEFISWKERNNERKTDDKSGRESKRDNNGGNNTYHAPNKVLKNKNQNDEIKESVSKSCTP